MENCLGNPKILANILAFLEGSNLADLEVVSREWNNCIAQSSLWKVRCMVDIERHELLDYISWHTIEKGELRFRGPLSDCTGEYWKRIYAEWWNGFTSIHHPYTTTQSTIELSEHESRKGTTVVTSAYMLGSWILVGTNNGEVFVYCRRQQKRIKTVQQHENRIISVLMFNERHVDKYDEDSKQEWGKTFVAMTEKCVLINTFQLQHEIVNDLGSIGRSLHFWKDFLCVYLNFADLAVYKVFTKSIWDGEHETRQLEVTEAFKVKIHESKMFLTDISMCTGKIFTCYTDESFHGHLKIISLADGLEKAHYIFTFSLNNFVYQDGNFVLFSYRKIYFFQVAKNIPKAPKMLTKEAKFIAVTPFCSYKLCKKAKFGAISQIDKTLQIHFDIVHKANQSSESLVPFKPDCVIETRSVFKYMLIDIALDGEGPTLVTLDNEGTLYQYKWPYKFVKPGKQDDTKAKDDEKIEVKVESAKDCSGSWNK